jgi:plastocyanin
VQEKQDISFFTRQILFKMFTRILAVAALAAPLASAAIIDVFVGGVGKLAFTPEQVTANPGDSIRFTFGAKNHTVTQSTFANPCQQITDANGVPSGFFSGYMPVAATQTTDLPQFWIPVKDTKPIWAFCSQANHCQQGMVFAVNAPADPDPKSFNNWKAIATGSATAQPAPAVTVSTSIGPVATETPAVTDPNNAVGADPYGSGASDPNASASVAPTTTVSANNAAATGTTGSGTVHQVIVGGTGQLTFQPDHITAAEGDVVQFVFKAKNHTATQSSFKEPCSPLAGGFDSGFMPSTDAGPDFPTYQYTVTNASAPIWVYCKQGNHCQAGMVFAINTNENSANTFAAYQANAKGASASASASASVTAATTPTGSASLTAARRTAAARPCRDG